MSLLLNKITDHFGQKSKQRLAGVDLARSLAILGMIMVNFKVAMDADGFEPAWMQYLVGLIEGRASATFVVLAGVGISLLSQESRLTWNPSLTARYRRGLFKRALFLFCIGLLYSPIWPADILHFYGIYIAVSALLLNISNRALLFFCAFFASGFLILLLFFDYRAGWAWRNLDYFATWNWQAIFRHLFLNGLYPVFPWTAFILAGMWLGRQPLNNPTWRNRMICYSMLVAIGAKMCSWWSLSMIAQNSNLKSAAYLLGTEALPPGPNYLLNSGAVAFAIIISCIAVAEKWRSSPYLQPLLDTGQLAFTIYVAHVVIGMTFLDFFELLENQPIWFAVCSACLFYVVSMFFAHYWKQRFRYGPLEWFMRRLTQP